MITLFGGLPFIQRANELNQNHKVAIIAAHLLLVGAIVLPVGRSW